MKKYYVLDTNILLQSPNAIYGFEDNTVVITGTTLQELDSKKNLDGEIGLGQASKNLGVAYQSIRKWISIYQLDIMRVR